MGAGHLLIVVEISDGFGHRIGNQDVIVGEIDEVFALAEAQSARDVCRGAGIGFTLVVADRQPAGDEFLDHLLRAIRGGIVTDHDFEGKVELVIVLAVGQRVSEIGFAVIGRDADAEFDTAQRLVSWP